MAGVCDSVAAAAVTAMTSSNARHLPTRRRKDEPVAAQDRKAFKTPGIGPMAAAGSRLEFPGMPHRRFGDYGTHQLQCGGSLAYSIS
jgi:hypothetical protein